MPVIINNQSRPVVWGDKIKGGLDIPNPPEESPGDYKWDGNSWVNDPSKTSDISKMSDGEIVNSLRSGDLRTEIVLAHFIESGRI